MTLPIVKRHAVPSSDGLRLQVVECGNASAPPIVFIHGYLFSSDVFVKQFASPLADTYRLIGIDLRGHGGSEKPEEVAAYSNARIWANDVASVFDALSVQRALIVGWSLGSRVALNYAWTHGFGRIAAFNFVGAVLETASHGPDAALPPQFRALLSPEQTARLSATRQFIDACALPGYHDREYLERLTSIAMEVPIAARRGSRSWSIPYDDDLSWVTARTLLTQGLQDPLVPAFKVRAQAEAIPNAELALLEGAGHLAFLQRAEHFNQRLAQLADRVFNS